jgi:hypothetical protein
MQRQLTLFFFFFLILSPVVVFAAEGVPCPPPYRNMRGDLVKKATDSAEYSYQASVTSHKSKMDKVKDSASRLADCLSKYKNFRVGGGLGLPTLGDALAAGLDKLARMTCDAIDQAYDDTTALARKEVVLPGGIASGDVGLPKSWNLNRNQVLRQGQVSVPGGTVTVKDSRPTIFNEVEDKARQEVRGIFK